MIKYDGQWYVGIKEQNMADINFGAITEALNNKVDLPMGDSQDGIDFAVDWQTPTEANGYTWYRKYKSGWVEQGGYSDASSTSITVTLPVGMNNTLYQCLITRRLPDATSTTAECAYIQTQTATTVKIMKISGTSSIYWQVSGMAA